MTDEIAKKVLHLVQAAIITKTTFEWFWDHFGNLILIHSLTHPRTHSLTHPLPPSLSPSSLTHSLTHSTTHTPTHSCTDAHTQPVTHTRTNSFMNIPIHPLIHSMLITTFLHVGFLYSYILSKCFKEYELGIS